MFKIFENFMQNNLQKGNLKSDLNPVLDCCNVQIK